MSGDELIEALEKRVRQVEREASNKHWEYIPPTTEFPNTRGLKTIPGTISPQRAVALECLRQMKWAYFEGSSRRTLLKDQTIAPEDWKP